jgi:hypothetical protein
MADEVEHSEPCRIPVVDPVTKKSSPCGVVKESLIQHFRVHNKKGGKKWNKKSYLEAFGPNVNFGKKFVPSPETQARWGKARDEMFGNKRKAKEIAALPAYSTVTVDAKAKPTEQLSYDERIQKRFEALWDQVNRDVPAEQFARDAARAEFRIEECNRRYEAAFLAGDWKTANIIMPQMQQQQDMLKKCMDFLDMTVKSRREKNQLGNDSVAQLVSNFGATLRRFSTEKQRAFRNRVNEVRRIMDETRRQKMLSEILDEQIDEIVVKQEMSESELDEKISEYVERTIGV